MICIIGAMPIEVEALTNKMSDIKVIEENEIIGKIDNKEVVVSISGVGKVNAAITTSMLINKYQPELIINIGSAGGLLPGQSIGDIVIANKLQYHDFDIGPDTKDDERFIFYTDKELMKRLNEVLSKLTYTFHEGLMVSGDQFILKTNPAFNRIQEVFFDAHCVEMEAASIAHTCSKYNVPFVVMRSLSDVVAENEGMQFDEYLPIAAENSAIICTEFIKDLNEN